MEGLSLQNRLPAGRPYRVPIETEIRSALDGLAGPWDVVIEEPKGSALVITVVAPDGSSWTMTCLSPDYRHPEAIGAIVRAACDRRRAASPPRPVRNTADPPGKPAGGRRT